MRLTLSERNVLWLQRALACGPVGSDLFHPSQTHHFGLDSQRQTWSALDTPTEIAAAQQYNRGLQSTGGDVRVEIKRAGFESLRAHHNSAWTCTCVRSGPYFASLVSTHHFSYKVTDAALASCVLSGRRLVIADRIALSVDKVRRLRSVADFSLDRWLRLPEWPVFCHSVEIERRTRGAGSTVGFTRPVGLPGLRRRSTSVAASGSPVIDVPCRTGHAWTRSGFRDLSDVPPSGGPCVRRPAAIPADATGLRPGDDIALCRPVTLVFVWLLYSTWTSWQEH
jgi:hypothetical protein